MRVFSAAFFFASVVLCAAFAQQPPATLGLFESQTDVGSVLHPGTATFDPTANVYTLSGSGENMWFATDEFHFVWKQVSDRDLTLSAGISILSDEGSNHRKGVLMIRQDLDPDSVYVDAARHGDGLTSLQYRDTKGGITREIESNVSGPRTLRLQKEGDRFFLWVGDNNDNLQFAGGSARVDLHAPFYVGIGVTAHDKNAVTRVAFDHVSLLTGSRGAAVHYSTVETILQSGDARTAYVSTAQLSSPGWSSDGQAVTFERNGKREQQPFTPLKTAAPVGPPLARPTQQDWVYVSSKLGETEQIWRKRTDGGQPEQLTSGEANSVAPHVSPDGKFVAFLSYPKGQSALPENGEITLRLLSVADGKVRTLATFSGGRGSLGEEPWSPDGKRLVFLSYQTVASE